MRLSNLAANLLRQTKNVLQKFDSKLMFMNRRSSLVLISVSGVAPYAPPAVRMKAFGDAYTIWIPGPIGYKYSIHTGYL
jgi:hypothetical protein